MVCLSLYGKTKSEERPILAITINGQKVPTLFDSGSCVTLLSWSAFLRLRKEGERLRPTEATLSGASGKNLQVAGETEIDMKIKERTFQRNVIVVRRLKTECILRADREATERRTL